MEKPRELNVVRVVRGEGSREKPPELDIKKYLRLFYKKRFLFVAIMMLVTSIIVAVGYLLPNQYEAKSIVFIERNYINDLMKGIAVTASIDDRVKVVSTIMQSRSLILKVIKELDLDVTRKTDDEIEKLVESFQKVTNVTLDLNRSRSDVDMFTVSVKHRNPVIARDYVNALVRLYIEENLSSKRDETFGAKKFLIEQVDILKDKINALEADIAKINKQIVAEESAAKMNGFKEDPNQVQLIALKRRLRELLQQYTPVHPEVKKIEDEIALLESEVKEQKRTTGKVRGNGVYAATSTGDATRTFGGKTEGNAASGAADPSGKTAQAGRGNPSSAVSREQMLKELERDRDTYQKMYEEMLATLGKSDVSSSLEVQDKAETFNVLEPAILPIRPVSPNRVLIIVLGLFAGIGAAIIYIIFLDSMDKSVKNVDTAGTFGLPVLAVFPYNQLPKEKTLARIKNLLLYAVTTVYLACVAGLLAIEVIKMIS